MARSRAALALLFALLQCRSAERGRTVPDAGEANAPTAGTGSDAPADAGASDASTLPTPSYDAPWPGWRRWPHTTPDCALFVPDQLDSVALPAPQRCSYQAEGCVEWTASEGAGYSPALSVASIGGAVYLSYARGTADGWDEVLLIRDDTVVGAWRNRIQERFCANVLPWLADDGTAAMVVLRWHAEGAPLVFVAPAGDLFDRPGASLVFGPPDAALNPNGIAALSDDLLVLGEHYGRFTLRERNSARTSRPKPDTPFRYLESPTPRNGAVYYWLWTGILGSIWRYRPSDGQWDPLESTCRHASLSIL